MHGVLEVLANTNYMPYGVAVPNPDNTFSYNDYGYIIVLLGTLHR